MSRELILPPARNRGAELISEKHDSIIRRLPSGLDPQLFLATCIAEVNEHCADCTPLSCAIATINCAMLGLVPGKALGHAYFIPFRNKGTTECTLIPGYKGYLELAFSNEFLRSVYTDVVLRGEDFDQWVDGGGPQIRHAVPLDRNLNRNDVLAAYCVYSTVKGGHGVEVVTRQELDKIPQRNVWKTDYIGMARKTAVRRAAKLWRTTRQLSIAIHLDEAAERDEAQPNFSGELLLEEPEKMSLKDIPDAE